MLLFDGNLRMYVFVLLDLETTIDEVDVLFQWL